MTIYYFWKWSSVNAASCWTCSLWDMPYTVFMGLGNGVEWSFSISAIVRSYCISCSWYLDLCLELQGPWVWSSALDTVYVVFLCMFFTYLGEFLPSSRNFLPSLQNIRGYAVDLLQPGPVKSAYYTIVIIK